MNNPSASVRPGLGLARVIALAALSVAATGDPRAQGERFTLTGDKVEVFDLAGEIRVEPGTGSAVVVEVMRSGKDAGSLQVRTLSHDGNAALAVAFPGKYVVYPERREHGTNSEWIDDDGVFGDRKSRAFSGHEVHVSSSGSGLEAHADLRVLVPAGKKIQVHHAVGVSSIRDVEAAVSVDQGVGDLDMKGVKGDVSLDTGAGAVSVADLRGDLAIDSGSGEVTLSKVHGDRLDLDSGSGTVKGSDLQVESLVVDSGSGSVNFRALSARTIRLDSGSGDVDLDLTSQTSDIDVDSGSGTVTLRVPADFSARYDIDGGSGGVEVGVQHQAVQVDDERAQGKIGDGRGRIRIDGGSGRVKIVSSGRAPAGRVGMLGSLLTHGVG